MKFDGQFNPSITIEIPDDPEKPERVTISLHSIMTPEIAEALNASWLYANGTIPQDGFKGKIALAAELRNVEVKLRARDQEITAFFPEEVKGFKIAKDSDLQLSVELNIETTGSYDSVIEFFRIHRFQPFELIVTPRQGDLFEGGTRVDMAGEEAPAEAPKRGRGRPRKNPAPEPVTVN